MKEPRGRREIASACGRTNCRSYRRGTGMQRSRRGGTANVTRKQASSDSVDVREQPQQRCKRRRGREPRSATGRSTSGSVLSVRACGHAAAPGHMAEGDDAEVAVLRSQGLVVASLTRAVFQHQFARLPLRSEPEMRTLAESLDLIVAGPRRRRRRPPDAEVQGSGNGSSGGRRVDDCSALRSHSRRTRVKLDTKSERRPR